MRIVANRMVFSAASDDVDGAEGMAERKWFVAVVNHNSEKKVAEKLGTAGVESYVATQTVCKVGKSGRKTRVEKVVIPSIVFVRCSEAERLEIVRLPYVFRFLSNHASEASLSARRVAIIPDAQVDMLRFMLGNSDEPVSFVDKAYCIGEKVRVVRGSLCGLEGTVRSIGNGNSCITVDLDVLGGASTKIETINLEPL